MVQNGPIFRISFFQNFNHYSVNGLNNLQAPPFFRKKKAYVFIKYDILSLSFVDHFQNVLHFLV